MTVSVLVPWRPDSPERVAAWSWLRPRWQQLGYEIVEGRCPDGGRWVKADAVADALTRATGDLLVIADADVWCDGTPAAVEVVESGQAGWAMPHLMVWRLAPGVIPPDGRMNRARHAHLLDPGRASNPHPGMIGGGIVAVTRALYEVAPLDPRFVGWGGEDEAWAHALNTMGGPGWRGTTDLLHMWHPPAERPVPYYGTQTSRLLVGRYRHAANVAAHPRQAMRELLDEIPAAVSP